VPRRLFVYDLVSSELVSACLDVGNNWDVVDLLVAL